MAQQVKVSATTPTNMSLNPMTYIIEGEDFYKSSSDFTCMLWHT